MIIQGYTLEGKCTPPTLPSPPSKRHALDFSNPKDMQLETRDHCESTILQDSSIQQE